MVEKGRINSASATHTLERIADIIAFFSKDYPDTEGRKVEIYSAIIDTLNKIDVEKRWTWKYLSNVESKHIKPGKRFAATIDVLWRMIQEKPIYVSVAACETCGEVHTKKTCPRTRNGKPQHYTVSIGYIPEGDRDPYRQLTPDQRRQAMDNFIEELED